MYVHTNETFITKTYYHKNAERNSTRMPNNAKKGYLNTPFCIELLLFDRFFITLHPIKQLLPDRDKEMLSRRFTIDYIHTCHDYPKIVVRLTAVNKQLRLLTEKEVYYSYCER